MGFLRLILAASVLISHASPIFGLTFTGSRVSVQTFFILSGFYMSLVLTRKYTGPGRVGLFLTNRFMRIFPAYWIILLLAAGWSVFSHFHYGPVYFRQQAFFPYADNQAAMNPLAVLSLLVANLTIFGQDILMFLGLDKVSGLFFLTGDFRETQPQVWSFLFVPQSWTLALELMFYVLAPFLVRRRLWVVLGLLFASLSLRLFLYYGLSLSHDPWDRRFFPTELAFFLMGVVAFRIYEFLDRNNPPRAVTLAVSLAFLAWTLGFQALGLGPVARWAYYAAAVPAAPFLFLLTAKSRADRWIGELSYPLYICHILVLWMLIPVLSRHGALARAGLATLAVSLAVSAGLVFLVILPLDRLRQRRVEAVAPVVSAVPAVDGAAA